MRVQKRISAVGVIACVATLFGCDSATEPPEFNRAAPTRLIEVVVRSSLATDVELSMLFGDNVLELGTVQAGGQEFFFIDQSLVSEVAARFIADGETRDAPIESRWMFIGEDDVVELLVMPLEVIRSNSSGHELDEVCPLGPCGGA